MIPIGMNVVIATEDISFASAGLTADNTTIIYQLSGAAISYKPGRSINGVNKFTPGKSYLITVVGDLDLEGIIYEYESEPEVEFELMDNDNEVFQDSDGESLNSFT